jgi:paraquat-inducible protein A
LKAPALTRSLELFRERPHEAEVPSRAAEDEAEWLEDAAEARRRHGAATARRAGLVVCRACALVCQPADPSATPGEGASVAECPRCGEALHSRKPSSIARSWALLISAFILYIPANVFPITNTRTLFEEQSDTIFSGVIYLWQAGSWPLALLVFFASITVPLAKLIVLAGLLISVQLRSLRKPAQRTRLYRIVEFIGRWSMLDIYAVAILTALVQLKSLAEVTAGPAVLAFGAVCVLTILASHSFDPRLIWDPIDDAGLDPDEGHD